MAYITTSGEAKPMYSVRCFNETTYKIIRFNRSAGFDDFCVALSDGSSSGKKSEPALSRARRMVFEKALCNEWDYFFTGTLDRSKYDRFNLEKFHRDLTEFFKYRRRVYGTDLAFLLVPEQHKDGAWHIHGLVRGIPPAALCGFTKDFFASRGLRSNGKLLASSYLCWGDYLDKFGFCSLAPIASRVAVSYYITKYVSKDLAARSADVGSHLYFSSRCLKTAVKLCDIYYPVPQLDDVCNQKYEFCSTGFVFDADWTFRPSMEELAESYTDFIGFPASGPQEIPEPEKQAVDTYQILSDSQYCIEGMRS